LHAMMRVRAMPFVEHQFVSSDFKVNNVP